MKTVLITLVLSVGAWAQAPLMSKHSEYPDPKLTPGATSPAVTQANIKTTICKAGYTATVRNVTTAEKNQVMDRYGLPHTELHLVEIDHFVSLELAGANDVTNLWPQYYDAAPGQLNYLGARMKDVVETDLHRRICSGAITLEQAQQIIKTDWVAEYQKIQAAKKKK